MVVLYILSIASTAFMLTICEFSLRTLLTYWNKSGQTKRHLMSTFVLNILFLIGNLISIFVIHSLDYRDTLLIPTGLMVLFALFVLYCNIIFRKLCRSLHEQAEKEKHFQSIKNNFIDNMSHEIRNPMNVIMGMTDILLKRDPLSEYTDGLTKIRKSSAGLLDTINEILDFTRLETNELELVEESYSVAEFVYDIEELTNSLIQEKPVELLVNVDPKIPSMLRGDVYRIKQLLMNVLQNSAKFTRVGIIILKVSCKQVGTVNKLIISVEDTGCGIREDNMRNLFTYQLRDNLNIPQNIDGMGLGLPITKLLLDLMGGDIHVVSKLGEGSTVTITIPQTITDYSQLGDYKEAIGNNSDENKGFTAPTARVLLVDDSIVNLFVEKQLFSKYGCDVQTAESGRECLNLVASGKYDIIFLDHMMPGMDGIETLRKLRSQQGDKVASIPVIALTANVVSGARQLFINEGFQSYIAKPVDQEELDKILLEYLPSDKISYSNLPYIFSTSAQDISETSWYRRVEKCLPDVNVREGLSHCGGDYSAYLNVLRVMSADSTNMIRKLRSFAEEGSADSYAIEAHALKSAAAGIGAGKLSFMAAEHERAGLDGNTEYVKNHLNTFISEYKALLDGIEKLLKEEDILLSASSTPVAASITKEKFREIVLKLKASLEDFNLDDSESCIKTLKQYRFDSDIDQAIAKIDNFLLLFKYEDAIEVIDSELLG